MQRTGIELLTEIENTIAASSGEERNRRIRALEQLVKARLAGNSRAVDLLCELISKVGPLEPEIALVTKYFRSVARANRPTVERLAHLVGNHHVGAIWCGCRVLLFIGGKTQASLACSLAKEVLQRDTNDSVTETLLTALKQLKHPDARRAVTREVSRCLDSPDGLRIRHAVIILSHLGDKSVEPRLVDVLSKLLDGYYGGHIDTIRESLCSYFVKFKSRTAVPGLLRGIEKRSHRRFAETVGVICDTYPEVQEDLLRLARTTSNVSIKLECLAGLATMGKTKPLVRDLAEIIEDDELRYDDIRANFKQALLRNPRESKPILLEMLRNNDERRYEFALQVLKEMDIPIEEVAKAVGTNPIVAIYNYFFEEPSSSLSLTALWGAKQKLGEGVKGTTTRLEHLVRHLLSCLGFITLDVNASRRPGVDTVAFPPTWSCVLLIGTTTGVVGDNLEKLANTVREVRATLGEMAHKIQILAIVTTSIAGETNPKDKEYAQNHGVVILRQWDIDRLVEWVSTSRSYKEFLAYLHQKAGRMRQSP